MKTKKAAIISGGGAWGAFGAGTLARLDNDYDLVAGTSTGALMEGLVALREWDTLKEGYTSITQKNIIDNKWYLPQPIKKNGKINKLAIIAALIAGNKTFGTSDAMRKTIEKFFTYDHFLRLKETDKKIIAACQNMKQSPSKVHYFDLQNQSADQEGYQNYVDWIWFSANSPWATSLVKKEWIHENGTEYMGQWTDAGLTELVPINTVLKGGYTDIDVILHREMPEDIYEIDDITTLLENAE